MPRRRGAACALVAFLCAVACVPAAADSAGKSKAHATHTVVIDAMRYSPPIIEVAVGDVVVWKNKDPFPHTVTAEDHSFDSRSIGADRTWKFKARKKGTFPYICTLHPTMKGELVVK